MDNRDDNNLQQEFEQENLSGLNGEAYFAPQPLQNEEQKRGEENGKE